MKIYNPIKIKRLLQTIEDNLTEEQQSIVKEIVSNYNKLYIFAKEKKAELDKKRKLYLKESEENEKLREKNKELKRRNNSLKIINKEQEELLKMYRKKKEQRRREWKT